MVGKRGFIDRASERADRRLAQRAGVADLLPLRRRRRLRGGDRRPPRRGRGRGAPQRLDRARATCAASARRRARTSRTRAARGSRRSARSRRCSTAAWARPRGPVVAPGQKGKLGIHHGVARADKALPEIAALIDKEQFELITQPCERHRRDPGRRRLGQDHRRAAPHRLPQLPGRRGGSSRRTRCSSCRRRRSCATSRGVLPALGVAACRS